MTPEEWYYLIKKKIEDNGCGYYISWWLRLDTGYKTSTINYHLLKLVKTGHLVKKSHRYGIEYYLTDKPFTI